MASDPISHRHAANNFGATAPAPSHSSSMQSVAERHSALHRRELRDLLLEFTTNELTVFTKHHIFKRFTPAQKRELLAELQRQLES